MDLTYATIPMFGGETKRLYRENQFTYIINNAKNSINHPIYAVDTEFGACILQIDDSQPTSIQLTKPTYHPPKDVTTSVWSVFFDGASTQASSGARIVSISPSKETIHLSYKMDFKTTNNIVEYEALLFGVKAAKEMGIMCIKIFGYVDLIIQQVNNTFQAKNVRLKAYRDEVWKLRDSFMFFTLIYT